MLEQEGVFESLSDFADVIEEWPPALAHFELGRVCGRGEDELLFRSEESLRLAEREESLQWEKRRLRYGAPTYYVREEGEGEV